MNHPSGFSFLYFIATFAMLWAGILLLLSMVGGWMELGAVYRAPKRPAGVCKRFRSAGLRWGVRYGSCLTFVGAAEGLHVSIQAPFRIGHPSLFVPWRDITVRDRAMFFGLFRIAELTFDRAPSISMRMRYSLFKDLVKAQHAVR